MIVFGDHHDLTIEKNGILAEWNTEGWRTGLKNYKWLATRSLLIGDLLSEETKINEFDYDPRLKRRYTGIDVVQLQYPETVGKNGRRVEKTPCHPLRDFEGAEEYIEDFNTDLDEAMTRFS